MRSAFDPELIPSDLSSILNGLDPVNPYQERLRSFGQLMEWLRLPVKQATSSDASFVVSRNLRLKFLFSFLENNPKEAKNFAAIIQQSITAGSAIGLYCLTGLSENHGFIGEITNRISQKFFPEVYSENDLSEIFKLLFKSEDDAIWIETTFKNNFGQIQHFLTTHSISLEPLKKDLQESKLILGAQIATLGTSRDIRLRLEKRKLVESSFLKLNVLLTSSPDDNEVLNMISLCRKDLEVIKHNLEGSGVSVDLIFKIEKIDSILDRIEMVIYLGKEYGASAHLILGQFIGRLIRDELKTRGVREYIRESLHLLTRKIVERAGEKGDHYIVATPQEQKKLFIAATLAGVLTAFTALCKHLIGLPDFPIFFEGFFFFINYSLSFLIMQKWHLALSSKQPAYMASALSRHFEAFKKNKDIHQVGIEIKKILRSQVITTVGNLIWVIPSCLLLDWIWLLVTGSHLMSHAQAFATIDKHNPLTSLTLPYAFLTGVLLWVSSVIAGWVENLLVFREVPTIIKNSCVLKKFMSREQLNYTASHFAGTVGGIAGNLSIAFLLTLPIVLSKFTSIPMDIRHVTLSAGTVTFAFSSLGWDLQHWPAMLLMTVSILVIGTLNFSVSFYFAIRMAATARNLEPKNLKRIFKYTFRY